MDPTLISILSALGLAILNFIVIRILNWLFGHNKNFLWKEKKVSIDIEESKLGLEELKKRLRIVVIDDEDSFPIKLFEQAGYAIDKWDKVEDYSKLENGFYDIIVLDITGIAQHISTEDGLGVLEDLKSYNPAQIIVAYSQHSFDLSKARFWKMADDQIAKPSDFLKIKKVINQLIEEKFVPQRYINSIETTIGRSSLNASQANNVKKYLSKSLKQKSSLSKDKLLEITKSNLDITSKILSLANALTKFYD